MNNLIVKDFIIEKKYTKSLVFSFLLIFISAQFFNTAATYIFVPFLTALSFIMYGYGFGEKNDTDVMLVSMPISRKDIVIERYISSVIFLIIGIIVTLIFGAVFMHFSFSALKRMMNFNDILWSSFSTIIYVSIYLPIYFKYGYIKAQLKNSYILTAVIALQIVMVMIATFVSNGTAKKFVMDIANSPNESLIFCIACAAACFVMFIASAIISLKIYLNRDL